MFGNLAKNLARKHGYPRSRSKQYAPGNYTHEQILSAEAVYHLATLKTRLQALGIGWSQIKRLPKKQTKVIYLYRGLTSTGEDIDELRWNPSHPEHVALYRVEYPTRNALRPVSTFVRNIDIINLQKDNPL